MRWLRVWKYDDNYNTQTVWNILVISDILIDTEKILEKVRVPQSQTAAFPRHQEEEETDKIKQAQIEQTYEKH